MSVLQRVCLALFASCSALSVAATGPSLPPDSPAACQISSTCTSFEPQDITGTILIKKKLTKPSVTASVSIYQRGAAVELGKDSVEDPLAFERSRVVIYLEGPNPAGMVPAKPATLPLQQLNRRFTPDLLVVPVGTTVSFPNMDPIFHNIFSLSKPKTFDLGSYNKGESRSVIFSRAGVVYVYCHLHPNMSATIVVTPNRWFARADPAGQFRIPDVPPGQYTIVAWHKAAGFFRKSILIEAGHNAVADFFIPIGDDAQQSAPMKAESMDGMKGR
jgi:plastocyanin